MPPIHETDQADERWTKAEWEHYELWEKVEHKHKKRTRRWILGALVVFVAISSVPVVRESAPKWRARKVARLLSQEIVQLQTRAGEVESPLRITLAEGVPGVPFRVERVAQCEGSPEALELLSEGTLTRLAVAVLGGARAHELGLNNTVTAFCYDPKVGARVDGDKSSGIVLGDVKDLAETRVDRFSVVLLSGHSAEITFD